MLLRILHPLFPDHFEESEEFMNPPLNQKTVVKWLERCPYLAVSPGHVDGAPPPCPLGGHCPWAHCIQEQTAPSQIVKRMALTATGDGLKNEILPVLAERLRNPVPIAAMVSPPMDQQ